MRIAAVMLAGVAYCVGGVAGDLVQGDGVIHAARADWNGDGQMDAAVLIQSKAETDAADLLIYMGLPAGDLRLITTNQGIAWSPDAPGMRASLQVTPHGTLVVRSGNEAISRYRWTEDLTLAWQGGAFVIHGYRYSSRDTLVAGSDYHCTVNLATGEGTKDNKAFKVSATAQSLSDWSAGDIPDGCR